MSINILVFLEIIPKNTKRVPNIIYLKQSSKESILYILKYEIFAAASLNFDNGLEVFIPGLLIIPTWTLSFNPKDLGLNESVLNPLIGIFVPFPIVSIELIGISSIQVPFLSI